MIRSVLYLQPRPGASTAMVDHYIRERVLERALEQPGCLGADIQVALESEGQVLITALWDSPEAYQGWVDNPVRRSLAMGLDALVDGSLDNVRGTLFEVKHAVTVGGEGS